MKRDFEALRDKVRELQRALDRAEGAKDQLLSELQEAYNCRDIKQGRKLLEKKIQQLEAAERKLEIKLRTFYTKWKDRL